MFKVKHSKKILINSKKLYIFIFILKVLFIGLILFFSLYNSYFFIYNYEKININYEVGNLNVYGKLSNDNVIIVKKFDFLIENNSLDRLIILKEKKIILQKLKYCENKKCTKSCSNEFQNENYDKWLWCEDNTLEETKFFNLDSINLKIKSFYKNIHYDSFNLRLNTVLAKIDVKNKNDNKIILIDIFNDDKKFRYYKIYDSTFENDTEFNDIEQINSSNQLKKKYKGFTLIFNSYIIQKDFDFLFIFKLFGIFIIIYNLIDLFFENLYLLCNPKLRKFILEKKFIRLTLETK